jgi:hypothetical protein
LPKPDLQLSLTTTPLRATPIQLIDRRQVFDAVALYSILIGLPSLESKEASLGLRQRIVRLVARHTDAGGLAEAFIEIGLSSFDSKNVQGQVDSAKIRTVTKDRPGCSIVPVVSKAGMESWLIGVVGYVWLCLKTRKVILRPVGRALTGKPSANCGVRSVASIIWWDFLRFWAVSFG